MPHDLAEIITCEGNFHGRTIAITGFSTVDQYRDGFGPYPAGFVQVPFGDAAALERAITPNTAAFLVEPIQGEGGVNIPPAGYLAECARICSEANVLLNCDEIQTGLGRTGKLLACEHDDVTPDGLTLGKALGGGLLPVSMFLARREVMDVFNPGDHGSTFGGNPISAAVGLEALNVLIDENLIENSAKMGDYLLSAVAAIDSPAVVAVRGRGLFIGMEFHPGIIAAAEVCERLLGHGILTKETHRNTVRFAPPLTISKPDIDEVLAGLRHFRHRGHEVIVLHILDSRERDLDFKSRSNTRFVDLENADQQLNTQPWHIQSQYREMMDDFLHTCSYRCAEAGIDYILLDTATPFDLALSRYLVSRKRLG